MRKTVKMTTVRMPISHAIEQWSGYCQRYSPYTRSSYARILHQFVEYSHCERLNDIQPSDIQTFINSVLSKLKPNTVNAKITALKSFFSWCSDMYALANPAVKIRFIPGDSGEARCLSEEEFHKCLEAATGRDYHLIRFLANTGLRLGELEKLTPASVNGTWLTVRGKGNKIRHLPLNDHAAESLKILMNFSRNRNIVAHQCKRIAKKAGILPFSPHALRHFFATRLLAKGAPIQKVSKILGHSSTVITEKIYYHFRPEHLAGLTDCLE